MPLFRQSLLFFILLVTSASAQVRITPDTDPLVFQPTELFKTRDAALKLTDTAPVNIKVGGLLIYGGNAPGDFTIISPADPNFILVPGSPQTIILRFTPSGPGMRRAFLRVESSDGELDVALEGFSIAKEANLRLSATTINFGKLAPDVSRDSELTVYNLGPDSARISGIQIANYSGDILLQTTGDEIPLPTVVAMGDSLVIPLRFTGALPYGPRGASVTISGDIFTSVVCEVEAEIVGAMAEIDRMEIDFGELYVGEPMTDVLKVISTGEGPINLSTFSPLSEHFTILAPQGLPFLVEPGATVPFLIRAMPITVGPHFSELGLDLEGVMIGGSKRLVTLNLVGLPSPIVVAKPADLHYSCLDSEPIQYTVRLTNTGIRRYTVLEGLSGRSSFSLITPMPLALEPGESRDVIFEFDPASNFEGTLPFLFANGDAIVAQDSVLVVRDPIRAGFTSRLVDDSTIGIFAETDLQGLNIKLIRLAVTIDRGDVADVDEDASSINETVIPDGTIGITKLPNTSTSIVEVVSSEPIVLDPDRSVADQPLAFIRLRGYVSRETTTSLDIEAGLPGLEACFEPTTAHLEFTPDPACGDESMRKLMTGEKLLSISAVAERTFTIAAATAGELEYALLTLTGQQAIRSQRVSIMPGQSTLPLDLPRIASGRYLLTLQFSAADGSRVLESMPYTIIR